MSALLLHWPHDAVHPALASAGPSGEDPTADRLAQAEDLIARQHQALREAETLLGVVADAAIELAAAHSPNLRRLTHAAERTRRLLASAS